MKHLLALVLLLATLACCSVKTSPSASLKFPHFSSAEVNKVWARSAILPLDVMNGPIRVELRFQDETYAVSEFFPPSRVGSIQHKFTQMEYYKFAAQAKGKTDFDDFREMGNDLVIEQEFGESIWDGRVKGEIIVRSLAYNSDGTLTPHGPAYRNEFTVMLKCLQCIN